MHYRDILYLALITIFVLLIPLAAGQFSEEIDWTTSDFLVAGLLIFGTGLAYQLIARQGGTRTYRAAVSMMLSGAFLLTWINLAVGIIGSENNPANLMYFGVLLIGIIGSLLVRFRPLGMSRVLFITALAQAIVPIIAFSVTPPSLASAEEIYWVARVVILSSFFALLFAGSGFLFHQAQPTTAN